MMLPFMESFKVRMIFKYLIEYCDCRLKSKAVKVDRAINLSIATSMKAHLFISMGLLLAGIFLMRGMEALMEPGFGLREIYILGGFLIAGLLVHAGWKERKAG